MADRSGTTYVCTGRRPWRTRLPHIHKPGGRLVDTAVELLVGLAAAAMTIASLLPQLLDEDSRGILKQGYLLMLGGFALWIVHGAMIESTAVVIFGVAGLACCTASLALRFRAFVRAWW
jgi:hypothetical protein